MDCIPNEMKNEQDTHTLSRKKAFSFKNPFGHTRFQQTNSDIDDDVTFSTQYIHSLVFRLSAHVGSNSIHAELNKKNKKKHFAYSIFLSPLTSLLKKKIDKLFRHSKQQQTIKKCILKQRCSLFLCCTNYQKKLKA